MTFGEKKKKNFSKNDVWRVKLLEDKQFFSRVTEKSERGGLFERFKEVLFLGQKYLPKLGKLHGTMAFT